MRNLENTGGGIGLAWMLVSTPQGWRLMLGVFIAAQLYRIATALEIIAGR